MRFSSTLTWRMADARFVEGSSERARVRVRVCRWEGVGVGGGQWEGDRRKRERRAGLCVEVPAWTCACVRAPMLILHNVRRKHHQRNPVERERRGTRDEVHKGRLHRDCDSSIEQRCTPECRFLFRSPHVLRTAERARTCFGRGDGYQNCLWCDLGGCTHIKDLRSNASIRNITLDSVFTPLPPPPLSSSLSL